jgi:hypothetical protein
MLLDEFFIGIARIRRHPNIINENSGKQKQYGKHAVCISGAHRVDEKYIRKRRRRGRVNSRPDFRISHGAAVFDAENGIGLKLRQTVAQHAENKADHSAYQGNVIDLGKHQRKIHLLYRNDDNPANNQNIHAGHDKRGNHYDLEMAFDKAAVSQSARDKQNQKGYNAKQPRKINLVHVQLVNHVCRYVHKQKGTFNEALDKRDKNQRKHADQERY